MSDAGATLQTFRQRFEAGWTRYVKPNLSFPRAELPADVYWDPRKGGWYTYPTNINDVGDKGWPKVDIGGFLVVPETIYDKIIDQYMALPRDLQPAACWDPRRAQWMYVWRHGTDAPKPESPTGDPQRDTALRHLINQVDNLYEQGWIGVHVKDEIERLIQAEL